MRKQHVRVSRNLTLMTLVLMLGLLLFPGRTSEAVGTVVQKKYYATCADNSHGSGGWDSFCYGNHAGAQEAANLHNKNNRGHYAAVISTNNCP
jgi:hypothetical protein